MRTEIYTTLILTAVSCIIGFLAQRSRMCFVAGLRDYILVRDRELLAGLFAFIATIWVVTSLFYGIGLLRSGIPEYGEAAVRQSIEKAGTFSLRMGQSGGLIAGGAHLRVSNQFLWVTLLGGIILGVLSTISGGCVLRQHVLAAQGNGDSFFFIAGFYCAVPVYYGLLFRLFVKLY